MTKKIVVTGAGGFVGPYLIKELQKSGENDIYAAVHSSNSVLSSLLPADKIMTANLTNVSDAENLIKEIVPDVAFHLASISVVGGSDDRASELLATNIGLQYNILEAVKRHAPDARFVAICSAHEYGLVKENEVPIKEEQPFRPLNVYGVSKIAQEMLALQYYYAYKLDVIVLRSFNHTGPGQTDDFVVPALAHQFATIKKMGTPAVISVGNTQTVRDFTDVSDMVQAYVLAGEKCEAGQVYNVGSGQGIAINDIITTLEDISGISVTLETNESSVRSGDVPFLVADITKFRDATGWKPATPFQETIKNVYNYYVNKG